MARVGPDPGPSLGPAETALPPRSGRGCGAIGLRRDTRAQRAGTPGQARALKEFVALANELRDAATGLERVAAHHEDEPLRHAQQIKREVKPAMERVRAAVDALETHVAADLWPLPTYRELLFLK